MSNVIDFESGTLAGKRLTFYTAAGWFVGNIIDESSEHIIILNTVTAFSNGQKQVFSKEQTISIFRHSIIAFSNPISEA